MFGRSHWSHLWFEYRLHLCASFILHKITVLQTKTNGLPLKYNWSQCFTKSNSFLGRVVNSHIEIPCCHRNIASYANEIFSNKWIQKEFDRKKNYNGYLWGVQQANRQRGKKETKPVTFHWMLGNVSYAAKWQWQFEHFPPKNAYFLLPLLRWTISTIENNGEFMGFPFSLAMTYTALFIVAVVGSRRHAL